MRNLGYQRGGIRITLRAIARIGVSRVKNNSGKLAIGHRLAGEFHRRGHNTVTGKYRRRIIAWSIIDN